MSNNIQVGVRIRPSKYSNENNILELEDKNSLKFLSNPAKYFSYDYIYDENIQQEQIFKEVGQNMIENMLKGYNCTIFAYGQTGTGKTYTMVGDLYDEKNKGLQLRCLEYLFWRINQMKEEEKINNYIIKTQFVEIYNEKIIDLWSLDNNNLNIREDINKGIYINGSIEEIINSYEEAKNLLVKGIQMRHIGETKMNNESSRSHSIFIVELQYEAQGSNGIKIVKNSKFNFVDLAGSERQKQTHAVGRRFKEGCNINKSLTVLGGVINNLVENCTSNKKHHIRYRDSKLTFLLKDSIGGNSKTFMIANLSPENECFAETLSTLMFAQRAKMIKNKAKINEDNKGKVEEFKKEIKRLKEEIIEYKNKLELYESGFVNNKNDNNSDLNDSNIFNNKLKDSKMLLEPFGNNLENDNVKELNLLSNIKLNRTNNKIENTDKNINLNSDEYVKSVSELERGLNQTLKILVKTQNLLENEIKKKEKLLDDIFHKKPPKLDNWNSKDITNTLKNSQLYLNKLMDSLENSVKLRKEIHKNYSEDWVNLLKTNEKESRISYLNQKINQNNEIIKLREEIYNLKTRSTQLEKELDSSNSIVINLKNKIHNIIQISREKIIKLKGNNNTEKNIEFSNIQYIEKIDENTELNITKQNIEIENLKKENNELNNKVNQLEMFNEKYKNETKIYKDEMLKLNENINYLENTKLRLIQWNEKNIKEKSVLKEKLKNYQFSDFNNNKDLQEEVLQFKKSIENLTSNINILNQEKNILEETINYKNNEINNMKNNFKNLENIIKINERKLVERDNKINNFNEKINQSNLIGKQDYINQIKNLEKTIDKQNNDLKAKNKLIENLENDNNLFDLKLEEIKKKYSNEKKVKSGLEKQLEKINKDFNNLAYEKNQLVEDKNELKSEISNLENENSELNKTINNLNFEIENKNKLNIHLKKQLEDEKIIILNHQEKNKLLIQENNHKVREINDLDNQITHINIKFKNLSENNENLENKNKILNGKILLLENENVKLERQSNNFFNNLLSIRSTIKENSNIMDDLILTSKLKSENNSLKSHNSSLETSIKNWNSQIENLTKTQISEIQDLKQYFHIMNEENNKIKKGLDYKNKEISLIKEENLKLLEKNQEFNKFILDLCSNSNSNYSATMKENLIMNYSSNSNNKNSKEFIFKEKLNTIEEIKNLNLNKRE